MRRSKHETTHEESLLAEALAASMISHDEELALTLQREQIAAMEEQLCGPKTPESPAAATKSPASASQDANNWKTAPKPRKKSGPAKGTEPSSRPESTKPSRHAISSKRSPSSAIPNAPSNIDYPPAIHVDPSCRHRAPSSSSSNSYAGAASSQDSTSSSQQSPKNDPKAAPSVPVERDSGPLVIVIDGQNVACSYGCGKFRARGIELALNHYHSENKHAVAMIPAYKVDVRSYKNVRVADDPQLLRTLYEQGRISLTPSGAHDDNFLLSHAMRVGADLVSNDQFRKELDKQETVEDARALKIFLERHLIPYTFVSDRFVPNPNPSRLSQNAHQSRVRR